MHTWAQAHIHRHVQANVCVRNQHATALDVAARLAEGLPQLDYWDRLDAESTRSAVRRLVTADAIASTLAGWDDEVVRARLLERRPGVFFATLGRSLCVCVADFNCAHTHTLSRTHARTLSVSLCACARSGTW
jgi:hypothetical protein